MNKELQELRQWQERVRDRKQAIQRLSNPNMTVWSDKEYHEKYKHTIGQGVFMSRIYTTDDIWEHVINNPLEQLFDFLAVFPPQNLIMIKLRVLWMHYEQLGRGKKDAVLEDTLWKDCAAVGFDFALFEAEGFVRQKVFSFEEYELAVRDLALRFIQDNVMGHVEFWETLCQGRPRRRRLY